MDIKFSLKKEFVVDGKKYASVEEMPPDVRRAFEQAMASSPMPKSGGIVVNGKEYRSPEEMPREIRTIYEVAVKAVCEESAGPGGDGARHEPHRPSADLPKAIEPGSPSFSLRTPLAAVILLAAIGLLLWFLMGRAS